MTSALISRDNPILVRRGLDRLERFVQRTRGDRPEVADQLVRLIQENDGFINEPDAARILESFLSYMMRSPRLSPSFIELITTAVFSQFRGYEGLDLARRDLVGLERTLSYFLEIAASRPRLAGRHFRSMLSHHLRDFVADQFEKFRNLAETSEFSHPAQSARARELAKTLSFSAKSDDLPSIVSFSSTCPELNEIVFWLRLAARVAHTLPDLNKHELLIVAKRLHIQARKWEQASARDLEIKRITNLAITDVQNWRAGVIDADRQSAHRRWVFAGRPNGPRYAELLLEQDETLRDGNDFDEDEDEESSRARRVAQYPEGSRAHQHLTEFKGPTVAQIDHGSKVIVSPAGLRALGLDLPEKLFFKLTHHYDEHIWERAEQRRSNRGFLRRRPPEYVTNVFDRLLTEIGSMNQTTISNTKKSQIDEAAEILIGVKEGLARENFETSVWSIAKRNEMIESLTQATWTVLEGQATHPSNVLVQAEVRGTRFNLAVCIREPCNGNLRPGGVASIYPVCGPGVFQIPRVSKITRTLDRLQSSGLRVNKDFRQGLVSAKPCRP